MKGRFRREKDGGGGGGNSNSSGGGSNRFSTQASRPLKGPAARAIEAARARAASLQGGGGGTSGGGGSKPKKKPSITGSSSGSRRQRKGAGRNDAADDDSPPTILYPRNSCLAVLKHCNAEASAGGASKGRDHISSQVAQAPLGSPPGLPTLCPPPPAPRPTRTHHPCAACRAMTWGP